jgi:hypothetical protein
MWAEVVGGMMFFYTQILEWVRAYCTFIEPKTSAFYCHSINLNPLE